VSVTLNYFAGRTGCPTECGTEVTESGKHSSILRFVSNYGRKKVYSTSTVMCHHAFTQIFKM